jgi:hypothetical protein
VVTTDVRGTCIARVHDFLTVGTGVLDRGVLVVFGLHVAEHVGPVRGAKVADLADVLAGRHVLDDRGFDDGLACIQPIWENEEQL